VVFQDQALDSNLTGRENLEFHGIMYGVPKKLREERIDEVLKVKQRPDHRYRIEHYEYPTDEDIQRTKELGIIASMQPNFVGEWAWPGGMYDTRLGKKRLERCNPYRKLLDLGVHIPFGSDGMPFHPL
jgi:predicted amidohydrolase YtcJ